MSRRRRTSRPLFRLGLLAGVVGLVATGAAVGPAATAQESNRLSVSEAADTDCAAGVAGGAGTDSYRVTAPVSGLVEARIAGQGDWDLAVHAVETAGDPSAEPVAASSGFTGTEVATGFVEAGTELVVQGCLLSGAAGSVDVGLTFLEVPEETETSSLVEVAAPTREDRQRLQELDLDLTEHADADGVSAVLHGEADAAALEAAGFTWTTTIPDTAVQSAADRRADEAFAAEVDDSGLPSGRTTYRRLADYEAEMKALVEQYPDLVRPITLAEPTVEGREVHGIEIATDVDRLADGKPAFLMMGAHHAREWPSSEHAMEWAYEVIQAAGTDTELGDLVETTRTIVVPIVNPDGFTISREAATTDSFGQFSYDNKRKNCSISENTPERFAVGTCVDNPAGRLRGTDLNRNYGGFWGGPGASPTWSSDTYRGDGPFSEPETRNVRTVLQERAITTLITNHTFGDLWLRPPGVQATLPPVDEPLYAELGARATSHNGYANIPSYELYDTTGGTEDWSFWTQGSIGFTPEIGTIDFHPEFELAVVGEYLGLEDDGTPTGLGGNSAAYLEMQRATADPAYHSTITGFAPAGWSLSVDQSFTTSTSPVVGVDGSVGEPITFDDSRSSRYDSTGGRFEFAVNPSTRPVVAGRFGREPTGPPAPGFAVVNPAGVPEENPDLDFDGPLETTTFEVVNEGYDNAFLDVTLEWGSASAADWDFYLEGPSGEIVADAATGDEPEVISVRDPVAGQYTLYAFNYDQTSDTTVDDWSGQVSFRNPVPPQAGETESWTLTCRDRQGETYASRQVVVDRGETVDVGNACQRRNPGRP